MNNQAVVLAQIIFFSESNGGRSTPFGNGLSPKIQLEHDPAEYFTELLADDKTMFFPGDQYRIEISIKNLPANALYRGLGFKLLQGEQHIGNGTIVKSVD